MKLRIDLYEYIEWRFADVEDDSQQDFLLDIFIGGSWKGLANEIETLEDFSRHHSCIPIRICKNKNDFRMIQDMFDLNTTDGEISFDDIPYPLDGVEIEWVSGGSP